MNNFTNNIVLLDPQPQTSLQDAAFSRYVVSQPLTAGVDLCVPLMDAGRVTPSASGWLRASPAPAASGSPYLQCAVLSSPREYAAAEQERSSADPDAPEEGAMRSMNPAMQQRAIKGLAEQLPWAYLIHTVDLEGRNVARSDGRPPNWYGDRRVPALVLARQNSLG